MSGWNIFGSSRTGPVTLIAGKYEGETYPVPYYQVDFSQIKTLIHPQNVDECVFQIYTNASDAIYTAEDRSIAVVDIHLHNCIELCNLYFFIVHCANYFSRQDVKFKLRFIARYPRDASVKPGDYHYIFDSCKHSIRLFGKEFQIDVAFALLGENGEQFYPVDRSTHYNLNSGPVIALDDSQNPLAALDCLVRKSDDEKFVVINRDVLRNMYAMFYFYHALTNNELSIEPGENQSNVVNVQGEWSLVIESALISGWNTLSALYGSFIRVFATCGKWKSIRWVSSDMDSMKVLFDRNQPSIVPHAIYVRNVHGRVDETYRIENTLLQAGTSAHVTIVHEFKKNRFIPGTQELPYVCKQVSEGKFPLQLALENPSLRKFTYQISYSGYSPSSEARKNFKGGLYELIRLIPSLNLSSGRQFELELLAPDYFNTPSQIKAARLKAEGKEAAEEEEDDAISTICLDTTGAYLSVLKALNGFLART